MFRNGSRYSIRQRECSNGYVHRDAFRYADWNEFEEMNNSQFIGFSMIIEDVDFVGKRIVSWWKGVCGLTRPSKGI